MYYSRLISLTLIFLIILVNVVFAEPALGSFVNIRFGNDITISWPRDWACVDGRTNKLINTATESTLKLAGIDANWHENRILINSFYRSSSKKRLASMRLSTRPDKSISQKDMKELLNASKEDVKELFSVIAQETRKAIMGNAVKSFVTVKSEIVKSKHMICFYSESEIAWNDSSMESARSITYICPTGTKSIKLHVSINKSVDAVFRPITRVVFESMQAR